MVYLDNSATTRPSRAVRDAMAHSMEEVYFNPSALYGPAMQAEKELTAARKALADQLGVPAKNVIFTSGGTESDNLAILGHLQTLRGKGEVLYTAAEHAAVKNACREAEARFGCKAVEIPLTREGSVDLEALEGMLSENTAMICVMQVCNETGVIMPIAEIGKVCRERGVLFHTDAVQAVGHVPIDVKAMNIDMLSLSAHKFHGPKGVGALYMKKGIRLPSYVMGGAQERNRRAGTENVAGIVGLGAAIALATQTLEESAARMTKLRDKLIAGIAQRIPEVKLNGDPTMRLPNNVNYSIKYIEGESILLMLDMNGIAASSGSACTSGSLDPSHVLLALGLSHEVAHGSVRMTLGDDTTDEDIDYVLETLPKVAHRLRAMSPISPID